MSAKLLLAAGVALLALLCCCCCSGCLKAADYDRYTARFPTIGYWPTSTGAQAIPFHSHAGDADVVWARADLKAVNELMAGSPLIPLQTASGHAIVSLWFVKYSKSTCGAYNEFVLVIQAAHRDSSPNGPIIMPDEPLEWIEEDLFNPNVSRVAWKLWLDQEVPIAYGRDILGYDKELGKVEYSMTAAGDDLKVSSSSGLEIKLHVSPGGLLKLLATQLTMMTTWHCKNIFQALVVHDFTYYLWGRPGLLANGFDQDAYPVTTAIVKNQPPELQYWSSDDTIKTGGFLSKLGIEPALVQKARGMRAVFMPPHNVLPAQKNA